MSLDFSSEEEASDHDVQQSIGTCSKRYIGRMCRALTKALPLAKTISLH